MTIINEHRTPDSILTAEQIEAAKTPEQRQAETDAAAQSATKLSLDSKVRAAVQQGGTLDADLGSADTAWTPGSALTLRNLKAMSQSQIKALTLAQTQELIGKLAPLLVDLAVTGRQVGKLTVQVYDSAS